MPVAYPLALATILSTKSRSQPAAFRLAQPRRGYGYAEASGTDTPSFFDVTWIFSQADALTFKDWFRDDLAQGVNEFTMPVKIEEGLAELTLRFLPDGILDTRQIGALWEYRATLMSRTGTGPIIVPPPPPPPPPPPAPPSGWWVSEELRQIVYVDGETGSDVTSTLQAAATEANTRGWPLSLPPWAVNFSSTLTIDKMFGVPGKSRLIPASTFTHTGFANQFKILSSSFAQAYNDSTAAEIDFRDFDIEFTPNGLGACIGLANIKGGIIERVGVKANRNLISGVPVRVDSLIDMYASVKNLTVRRCRLINITGGYGTTKFTEFGGSCMWIRNLTSNGSNAANVTEGIRVHHNYFEHMTSDEVLAVFGVRGTTRNVKIHHNTFNGLASYDGVHHNTFISFFPLDDGTGANLGDTAAVYDVDFFDNDITDRAAVYDVVRIGNGPDNDRPCYNIRLSRNRVRSFRSTDPTIGVQAMWTSLGEPGPDPEVSSSIFRCINGTFGLAYFRDTSGNTTSGDVAENTGATCNMGFNSFQQVDNPTTLGDIFTGAGSCLQVNGGKIECAFRAFQNCRQVVGTKYRVNGTGGVVFDIDSTLSDVFSITATNGETFGRFVRVTNAAAATTAVGVFNNVVKMTTASAYYLLENSSAAGATLDARGNISVGANAGITTGAGTIARSLNRWNGTTD